MGTVTSNVESNKTDCFFFKLHVYLVTLQPRYMSCIYLLLPRDVEAAMFVVIINHMLLITVHVVLDTGSYIYFPFWIFCLNFLLKPMLMFYFSTIKNFTVIILDIARHKFYKLSAIWKEDKEKRSHQNFFFVKKGFKASVLSNFCQILLSLISVDTFL